MSYLLSCRPLTSKDLVLLDFNMAFLNSSVVILSWNISLSCSGLWCGWFILTSTCSCVSSLKICFIGCSPKNVVSKSVLISFEAHKSLPSLLRTRPTSSCWVKLCKMSKTLLLFLPKQWQIVFLHSVTRLLSRILKRFFAAFSFCPFRKFDLF